jgi:hypothetical protein
LIRYEYYSAVIYSTSLAVGTGLATGHPGYFLRTLVHAMVGPGSLHTYAGGHRKRSA